MNSDISDVKDIIKGLVDQPLTDIGRAADMLWVYFGESVTFVGKNGKSYNKNHYGFDIQCPWRITKNDNILLGFFDMFVPQNHNDRDFVWDIIGSNMFDKEKDDFLNIYKNNIFVKKIRIRSMGDLEISFNNGIKLEVYPSHSVKHEFWRFMIYDVDRSEHYVVFDNNVRGNFFISSMSGG